MKLIAATGQVNQTIKASLIYTQAGILMGKLVLEFPEFMVSPELYPP